MGVKYCPSVLPFIDWEKKGQEVLLCCGNKVFLNPREVGMLKIQCVGKISCGMYLKKILGE